MDLDRLDIDALKALAMLGLDRLADPPSSSFADNEREPAALSFEDWKRNIEDLPVLIEGDFEEEPTASIKPSEVKAVVEGFKEEVTPYLTLLEEGQLEVREKFVENFSEVVHTTVAHPVLMEEVVPQNWWDRADALNMLPQAFRSMMSAGAPAQLQQWLEASPSMGEQWGKLFDSWTSLGSAYKQQQWLGLVINTPTTLPPVKNRSGRLIPVDSADFRQRRLNKEWADAQLLALFGRTRSARVDYQSLANAIRATGEVTIGLESLPWSRAITDNRQPDGITSGEALAEGLSRIAQLSPDLAQPWVQTPDDAPMNWEKEWHPPHSLSDSQITFAVGKAMNHPRKMIQAELGRFVQRLAFFAKKPELTTYFDRLARAASLEESLPAQEPQKVPKPRF